MIAASTPVQRPVTAKLLAVDRYGRFRHMARSHFASLLRPGDLVIANDAATIPASLRGTHEGSGQAVEVRLVGRASLAPREVTRFSAIIFGAGDFRTPTEDRPSPPPLRPGDRLLLGPLRAVVTRVLAHPRFIELTLNGESAQIWEGLARHGRPIQYSHLPERISLWDTWTPIAGPPAAFEPPSAGFLLDWRMLELIRSREAGFATITHAAGISSTGDETLDALLPLDEPYRIPESTARAIAATKGGNGRVIAIGTTVVRALEHAALATGFVHPGENIATQRIGPSTRLQIVDVILSGTHQPGTSHYQLLRAFIDDATILKLDDELEANGYRTHEFGDSVFLEKLRFHLGSIAKPNIESPAATTRYWIPSNS